MLLSGRTSQAARRCRSSRVACRSPPQSLHGLTYQHTLLSQSSCCHYQRVLLTLPTRCYRHVATDTLLSTHCYQHIAINTLLSTHTALSVFLLSLSTSFTNATDTLLPTHCYQHTLLSQSSCCHYQRVLLMLPTHCYQHIAINTLL